MRELLASWIAALLPRRVVAHAFARVLADVRFRGSFEDPCGVSIVKVTIELFDKQGLGRETHGEGVVSLSMPTPGGR